jgi:hypothetical protein
LRSVNQLFYENTADGDYATFFLLSMTTVHRGYAMRIVGISRRFSCGMTTLWNDWTLRPRC